ncbi:hypothetical protein Golob_013606, partial [Gossypium lobatum]|nr:hypothetical protein [Gossypium lobatum]
GGDKDNYDKRRYLFPGRRIGTSNSQNFTGGPQWKADSLRDGQNLFMIKFEDEGDLESIMFLFWLKIGPCPPECDKKDLTHAIGSTFGGIISSKVMGDLCHIKVELDVQKPLHRRIFILAGHKIKDCNDTPNESKELSKNDMPFFLALKAESNLIMKVSMWLGVTMKKSMPQCYYLGRSDEGREGNTNFDTVQGRKWTSTKDNLGIREIKTNLN